MVRAPRFSLCLPWLLPQGSEALYSRAAVCPAKRLGSPLCGTTSLDVVTRYRSGQFLV